MILLFSTFWGVSCNSGFTVMASQGQSCATLLIEEHEQLSAHRKLMTDQNMDSSKLQLGEAEFYWGNLEEWKRLKDSCIPASALFRMSSRVFTKIPI